MKSAKSISRTLAIIGAVVLATQFAMIPAASAKGGGGGSGKAPHCFASPVAGQPGTYVWTCTTGRP